MIYDKHIQKCAIDFVDYVRNKFPFRIHTIQTDNGHEFQSKFHWHIIDLILICKYKGKLTPAEKESKNREKQQYIISNQKGFSIIFLLYNCVNKKDIMATKKIHSLYLKAQ